MAAREKAEEIKAAKQKIINEMKEKKAKEQALIEEAKQKARQAEAEKRA